MKVQDSILVNHMVYLAKQYNKFLSKELGPDNEDRDEIENIIRQSLQAEVAAPIGHISRLRIKPEDILFYMESFTLAKSLSEDQEDMPFDSVEVVMKGDDTFILVHSFDEFEAILADYYKQKEA